MAKKTSASSSSVNTNTFIKGMNKDITQSMEPNQSWWHARNAANNSTDGDLGVIGNEPSNFSCGEIPYTIIGAIKLYSDKWVIYSTDNINSEIGIFDDSECKYTTLVNDPCLNFNKKFLISGAAKENFDCTWQVYWDDSNNPSRTLNIDNVPWIQDCVDENGIDINTPDYDPVGCITCTDTHRLDCEEIRLAPLLNTPCVSLSKAEDGGLIRNGTYQAFIAYVENEARVTDYIGISNLQSVWSHEGSSSSLNIKISNLDTDYEFFELVIYQRNQGQAFTKKIGLYSTQTKEINIDFISDQLESIDQTLLPQRSPAYEKSEAMYVVNDYLIRQGPTEQFDFNYQPIANQIKVNWVTNRLPAKYYNLAGNKLGFMRDEQYAFFIRWIYNTGERSSSYHIPGRPAKDFTLPNGDVKKETDVILGPDVVGDNLINTSGEEVYKIYNTGTITQSLNIPQLDGSTITARGEMAYWESTERYPADKPEVWDSTYVDPATGINIGETTNPDFDLCGKPIRHHKFPSEEKGTGPNSPLYITSDNGDFINILGVEFTNIGRPKYNDGTYIPNVVGYEILRGSRLGAKSILAKGLFRNMRKYRIPNADNLIGGNVQGLYPNYPYNDLRPDPYFFDKGNDNDVVTEDCHNYAESIQEYPPLSGYTNDVFTFASPDLMFFKPFLNAYETKIYGEMHGNSSGSFKASENHPQFKLLRNVAVVVGLIAGLGYALKKINGTRKIEQQSTAKGGPGDAGGVIAGTAAGVAAGQQAATTAYIVLTGGAGSAITNLADLFSGGAGTRGANSAWLNAQLLNGAAPGIQPSYYRVSTTKDSDFSNLDPVLKGVVGLAMSSTYISIGADELIEFIYNQLSLRDFALKYNSHGFFTEFKPIDYSNTFRSKNNDSNYIGQSFQLFDEGKYKINNLFRPTTVAVSLDREIDDPSIEDTSRFQISGSVDKNGQVVGYDPTYREFINTQQKRPISAHYGALKFNIDNQYGQLSGIKQIPMRDCIQYIDFTKPEELKLTSEFMFSGDIYIGRYTEKVIMPIFAQYLLGQPDEFSYDYSKHVNIPYPRFWLDSTKYDISKLIDVGNLFSGGSILNLPNDKFYLDRGSNTCVNNPLDIFNRGGDPNPAFAMVYAYMYTHVNGVLDFFVESEYNLAYRDWEDRPAARIYDTYTYNDLTALFHAEIQKIDNFYKYDESLSATKFPTQLSGFGEIQPLYYDPYTAEECYVYRPKRLIYSLRSMQEARKDYWRVFLPLNYVDFKDKISVIKPMNRTGAIMFFPYQSPRILPGVDQLQTGLGNKVTIGDGGLFKGAMQNVANSEIANEYGSNESMRSVISTPSGLFYISQAQGKIFQYSGKGLDPISNQGMKWWFNKYLPSNLIKQFPELEFSKLADNPVVGIGCQSVYDINDDIVYFMKKDFKIKEEYLNRVSYTEETGFIISIDSDSGRYSFPVEIGDPAYFDDCCWTVSYDPKAKAWISFHDWCPELSLPSINHFFTTKTKPTDIAQCPPGYNYNPSTELCEKIEGESTPANVLLSLPTEPTLNRTGCPLDIVFTLDASTAAGDPMDPSSSAYAQIQILIKWIEDSEVDWLGDTSNLQVGILISSEKTANHEAVTFFDWTTFGIYNWSMTNRAFGVVGNPGTIINTWMVNNWHSLLDGPSITTSQDIPATLAAAQDLINRKPKVFSSTDPLGSELDDRSATTGFKQQIIHLSRLDTPISSPAPCNMQGTIYYPTTGVNIDQEVYGVGVYENSSAVPANFQNIINSLTCTTGPYSTDDKQFLVAAGDPDAYSILSTVGYLADTLCNTIWTAQCPVGYTMVFLNAEGTAWTEEFPLRPISLDYAPICRKIECECPPSPDPNLPTYITGTCDDVYKTNINGDGDPDYVNLDPQLCYYSETFTTKPSFEIGTLWRHNARCDSFANYYDVAYPWEVDLIENSGQNVNTVRSIEYQLETYVYKGDLHYACGDDRWEDLNFNFDESIIYNNEQVSGLLKLIPTPFNNPILELSYPIINTNSFEILCSKVEQKYRFNQFYDITNDRGEFTNAQQAIFDTECNGYIRNLNPTNLNYNKAQLQHKKFRHYYNHVLLRRTNSLDRKMLLRLHNTKLLLSRR